MKYFLITLLILLMVMCSCQTTKHSSHLNKYYGHRYQQIQKHREYQHKQAVRAYHKKHKITW